MTPDSHGQIRARARDDFRHFSKRSPERRPLPRRVFDQDHEAIQVESRGRPAQRLGTHPKRLGGCRALGAPRVRQQVVRTKRQRPDGSFHNVPNWMEADQNLVTGYALMALSYCKPK